MSKSAMEPVTRHKDLLTGFSTYGAVLLVFAPVCVWLAISASQHEQLLNVFVILLGVGLFLAWENWKSLRWEFAHDVVSLGLLLAAFCMAGLHIFIKSPLLTVCAFVLAIAGLVRFTFGRHAASTTLPLLIAFACFVFLALLFPMLDWPLRVLAGQWSAALLDQLGASSHLLFQAHPVPALYLESSGRPFVVAAECNGFGLLSSTLLLVLTLGLYRRLKWLDYTLLVLGGAFLALIGNMVRIAIIVLLAPRVSNYDLMHEAVGILVYYAVIIFAAWFTWSCPQRRTKPSF